MNVIEHEYKWSSSLSKRSKTTKLVLHHAAAKNCTADVIHRWHLANGWSGIGYHYFVSKDGRIWRGRPENTVGAHAKGANSVSVGICFEGNFDTESQMPQAQFDAGVQLCAMLSEKYSIDKAGIKRHSEINATACPGKYFPFEEMVKAAFSKADEVRISVKEFQLAAIADGFKLARYGADGIWGAETEAVAKKAIVKRRAVYKYKNLTRLVQTAAGVQPDGLCGVKTDKAIRAWQSANGLVADGAVGIKSWRKFLGV